VAQLQRHPPPTKPPAVAAREYSDNITDA
jgi:hypothetical protein